MIDRGERGERGVRRLARDVSDLRESHDALRASQLPWSSVPVVIDGEEVTIPVVDALALGSNAGQVAMSAAATANAAEAAASAAEAHITEIEETVVTPMATQWGNFYDAVGTLSGLQTTAADAAAAAAAASSTAAAAQTAASGAATAVVTAQARADAAWDAADGAMRLGQMIPNGAAERKDSTGWGGGTTHTFDPLLVPPGSGLPGAIRRAAVGGTVVASSGGGASEFFDVLPSTVYYYDLWLYNDTAGSKLYVELRDQAGTLGGTMGPSGIAGDLQPGAGNYLVGNLVVPVGWTRYRAKYTTTATATKLRLGSIFWNHSTGVTGAVQAIAGLRMAPAGSLLAQAVLAQQAAESAAIVAAAANSLAGTAQANALQAISDAAAAAGVATTATGKYTVATVDPVLADGTGKPTNAVWEVRHATSGVALRRFYWSGSAWVAYVAGSDFIGPKAIGQAQIGDLAVGTAQIADGAITDLQFGNAHGGKLLVNTVGLEQLVVQPGNVFPDPWFKQTTKWAGTGISVVAASDMAGGSALRIESTLAGQRGAYYGGTVASNWTVQVDPGGRYRVRALVSVEGSTGSRLNAYFRGVNSVGTAVTSNVTLVPTTSPLGLAYYETTLDAPLVAPATAVGPVTFGIFTATPYVVGSIYRVADVTVARMASGTMIDKNGILTDHLTAESVQLEHLHGDVGKDLDISANGTINVIAGTIGTAQETATAASTAAAAASASAASAAATANAAETAVGDQAAVIDGLATETEALAEAVEQQAMYYAFSPSGLVLGVPGAEVGNQLHIDNDSITFLEAGDPTLWLADGVVHATRFEGEVVALGRHQFERDGTTGTIVRSL